MIDPDNLFDNDDGIYVFGDPMIKTTLILEPTLGKIGKDQFIFHCIKIILIRRLVLIV